MNKEHFWNRIKIGLNDQCWEWQKAKSRFGYGWLTWNGVCTGAHRIAWVLTNGEIPEGMCVLHKCDNPPCCNPNHLFLGTRADNCADMRKKGRDKYVGKPGEANSQAKLSKEDVIRIRMIYKRGVITQRMIAAEYGITRESVKDILQGKNWRHIPGWKRTKKLGHPTREEVGLRL